MTVDAAIRQRLTAAARQSTSGAAGSPTGTGGLCHAARMGAGEQAPDQRPNGARGWDRVRRTYAITLAVVLGWLALLALLLVIGQLTRWPWLHPMALVAYALTIVPFAAAKMAAALLFATPALPLLFMGEEYGETSPFQFFTSFLDPALVEAVRHGRAAEFARFGWGGKIADPSEPATFLRSRLSHPLAGAPRHRELRDYYRQWLSLRRSHPALGALDKERTRCEVDAAGNVLTLSRRGPAAAGVRLIANLTATPQPFTPPSAEWRVLIDSEDTRYAGSGTVRPLVAYQAVLYDVGE